MTRSRHILVSLLLFGVAACSKTVPAAAPGGPPLVRILQNNFQFSLYYHALVRTGLDSLLEAAGPFTLFPPDNNDFAQSGILSEAGVDSISVDTLRMWMGYTIVPQRVYFLDIPQGIDNLYRTIEGDSLYVSAWDDPSNINNTLTVNGRYGKRDYTTGTYDVVASNGVIHEFDGRVLKPPVITVKAYLEQNPNYTIFVAALKKFGLFDQLDQPGPFTVFVSNNNDFLNNGIDMNALAQIDTLTYKKYLFGCYILNKDRMFISDVGTIGEIVGTTDAANPTPDGVLLLGQPIEVYNPSDPTQTPIGGYCQLVNQDNLMRNGVVDELNDLLVYPNNMLR